MAAAPVADLAASLRSFFDAGGQFFGHLADIDFAALAAGLLLYTAMLMARTRAWHNVLHAAFPRNRVSYLRISAAYLAGAGLNGIIPARVGDAVKIFLAKNLVPGSSYATITSSFFVQSVFDTFAGVLVLVYAVTQGLLPRLPELPDLPAFDISFWANHPRFLLFTITIGGIALIALFIVLAQRAEQFWQRIKQGGVILSRPRSYLRHVASWQAVSWLFRFGSYWLLLDAFQIGGSVSNVLLVFSVQSISTLLPFTPGGAGAQQALLVATLEGPSRAAVLSYSVGQQIAIAAWSALLGFLSLVFVFRTRDWRGLMRQAEEDAREERPEAAAQPG